MTKKNKKKETAGKSRLSFSALNKSWIDEVMSPTESEFKGKDFIAWGDNNAYPQYLHRLYEGCATLQSIIDATVDYICGIETITQIKENKKGESIEDIIRNCAYDLCTYGGFSINVLRNKLGDISNIYYLDFKRVRSNKTNTVFYYSDSWTKWQTKAMEYPKFGKDRKDESSVFYFKLNGISKTYPTPLYGAATMAAETLMEVDKYHLTNIKSGFSPNFIINFMNGIPSDEVREEIEADIFEKYTGSDGLKFILNFAVDKEHASDIQALPDDNIDKKYDILSKWCRQQLFTSFRANPNLFGINSENTNFNAQEFEQAYKLYEATIVLPLQRKILKALDRILGEGAVTIKPFKIDWDDDTQE